MQHPLDFLNSKCLLRYLCLFAIVLLAGYIAKDAVALLIVVVILFYVLKRNFFRAIELWLVWFFVYGFYTSQGLITNEVVAKYITKPPFILFVIFISFFSSIPAIIKNTRFVFAWLIFLSVSLFSIVYHGQSPFVLITISSFFIIYLILSSKNISKEQCIKLMNLFIAVAILQTAVSFLQVSQLISAPTKMMDDGSGGQVEWIAGLDDVASGTFGAASSSVVSWYVSFIALFSVLIWASCKKNKYLIIAAIALLQFATVDSKTILVVMALMMVYLLLYFNKHRFLFALKVRKLVSIILIIGLMGYGLFLALGFYYQYQSEATSGASKRSSLNTVYEDEIKKSEDLVVANIGDWGKVQGFRYVSEDFMKEGIIETLFGYGLLGYTYNGKMHYIEGKDTRLMQLNNFTRSRSSLITQFAQSGFIGSLLFFVMLFSWAKNNVKNTGAYKVDVVINGLVKIFLPFTLLAAFIYSVSVTSITVIGFAALIAVLRKYSEKILIEEEEFSDEEFIPYQLQELQYEN